MLILARKHPLKRILLILVTLIMIGNIGAALAPNYWILLLARFVSGLPHGAYFGVGSIVAEKLADKGKGSEAVSIMVAGHFPAGRLLGNDHTLLHLALDTSSGEPARYGTERSVPLSEIARSVAADRCNHAGQRRRVLLVQLYQSATDACIRFPSAEHHPADPISQEI